MEPIDLQIIKVVSPVKQEIDFVKATVFVVTNSAGMKSWIIKLIGPTTLTKQLNFTQDIMQLMVNAVDGRILYGDAFIKKSSFSGPYINMTLMGTGPLTPGAL